MAEKRYDKSRAIIFIPSDTERQIIESKKELSKQLEKTKTLNKKLESIIRRMES